MLELDIVTNDECRLCLLSEPAEDLIRPCNCNGSLRYTHRKCLDRWRYVSPHPDSVTTCEICKSKFKIVHNIKNRTCFNRTRYGLAVALDISFFIAVIVGLWIGFGYLGDLLFNFNIVPCTTGICLLFRFTSGPLWEGRIWFWGFIVLFFVMGIVGILVFCCYRKRGDDTSTDVRDSPGYYSRSDCYWICCGPTYYNGFYYGSPYGYWNSSDMLCCYLCMNSNMHYHHHAASGCNCNGCTECNSPDLNGCNSKDGPQAIVIILAIVVLIVVLCGLIFAAFVSFMIMNKIIKRHLYLLERKEVVESEIVVDLDDPFQVAQSSKQAQEGFLPTEEKQLLTVSEDDPYRNLKPPKTHT